jgi:hypothetical protein
MASTSVHLALRPVFFVEDRIETSTLHWGAPTLVVRDLDGNELFFWLPQEAVPAANTGDSK